MTNTLKIFVEDLLAKAGMSELPVDFRQQYIAKLVSQIEERIGLRALEELDEEQLADFERLVKGKKNPAAVFEYFNLHVHDFRAKMAKVMEEFAAEFLKHSLAAKQELQTTRVEKPVDNSPV